ncbi:MAG TPA: hypothetical protein VMC84_05355 [Methanocella sp.]|uniref:hypothetical protein n=1 Tax=Methanocella sp. TaxID=2052833 RepID=UPI002C84D5C8|nr:hypothetical protein [Methanocella sp.]HTY90586.1 hypothetical protein [Methanocella sp.]
MLLPSDKPIFENVNSSEYFTRAGQLKDGKVDGIIHFIFPGYEEALIYSEGRPVTGIHEAKRWMTVGDELVEAVENKAIAAPGRMAAYKLDPAMLQVFMHKTMKSMVETTLGKYLSPILLIGYLGTEKSTSVVKFYDDKAIACVFINNGKRVGAAYASPEVRSYGESAIKDMARFKENTSVAIYFMESAVKARPEMPAAEPARPAAPAPVEAPRPIEAPTIEPTKPSPPARTAIPVESALSSIQPRLARPLPVPPVPKPLGIRLSVAMSEDDILGLRHRSHQQVLETLEEGDVAWVDTRTLASLRSPGEKVQIVLPDGREYPVTLKEADIEPVGSHFIILPRKLRGRLSIERGMMVEVKE